MDLNSGAGGLEVWGDLGLRELPVSGSLGFSSRCLSSPFMVRVPFFLLLCFNSGTLT